MLRIEAVVTAWAAFAVPCVGAPMSFSVEGLPEDMHVVAPIISSVPHEAEPGSFLLTAEGGANAIPAQIASSPAGRGVELCLVVSPEEAELAKQPLRPGRSEQEVEPLFRFEEDKEKGILDRAD